jgi:hypothetical protein
MTSSGGMAMLNRDFDPLGILEEHEETINKIILSHNNLAKLAENLADQNNQLNERTERLEDELNRLYVYIGEQIQ